MQADSEYDEGYDEYGDSEKYFDPLTFLVNRSKEYLTHKEIHDDRVLFFMDDLPAGFYEFTYLVRATTVGSFVIPPARVEAMYNPDVYSTTEMSRTVIE